MKRKLILLRVLLLIVAFFVLFCVPAFSQDGRSSEEEIEDPEMGNPDAAGDAAYERFLERESRKPLEKEILKPEANGLEVEDPEDYDSEAAADAAHERFLERESRKPLEKEILKPEANGLEIEDPEDYDSEAAADAAFELFKERDPGATRAEPELNLQTF